MAYRLPLYRDITTPLDKEQGEVVDSGCTKCPLFTSAKSVCIPAEGSPGGLLVIGENTSRDEDLRGRPFLGQIGKFVRDSVSKHWSGNVAYDTAVRCIVPPALRTKNAIIMKAIQQCRGYLKGTVDEVKPSRILLLGSWPMKSVLGYSVAPLSVRRSYAHLADGTPVFSLIAPGIATRNRFIRKWFEADIEWSLTATVQRAPINGGALVVETEQDAAKAVSVLRRSKALAFDVETWGRMFDPGFEIVSFSIGEVGADSAFVWSREACRNTAIRAPLLTLLLDRSIGKIGSNTKYDMLAVYSAWGIHIENVSGDVRLWRKLLDPEASGKLADMANLVGMGGHKQEAGEALDHIKRQVSKRLSWERRQAKGVVAKKTKALNEPPSLAVLGVTAALEPIVRHEDIKPETWAYGMLPDDILYRYNALDVVSTGRLAEKLDLDLDDYKDSIGRVWKKIVHRASNAVAHMERWGICVDRRALDTFDIECELKEKDALGRLSKYTTDTNWDSPKQVADFFYRKLGMTCPKYTESGAESVDKEVLTLLSPIHPAAEALIDLRRASKLRGTYASGMYVHIRSDGKVHPTLLLDGATSGRTSCRDPNLQNLPRSKKADGKLARDIFVASPGCVLVQLDYSQLELRVAAMLAKDKVMTDTFLSGVDFHQKTAEMIAPLIWKVDLAQIVKTDPKRAEEYRSLAKAFNFGIMYGKTDSSLAEELNIPKHQAAAVRRAIFGQFTALDAKCKEWQAYSRKHGDAWTEWEGTPARRRSLFRIGDPEDGVRISAENSSINTPIQGTASDFCLNSLGAMIEWILDEAFPARLVLAIHDSLVFDVEESMADELISKAREVMTGWESGDVPLIVDAEKGYRFGSMEKVKLAA